MSANNQAEPAAAVAAAAASPAASASEYLKRTCLICGCQTNQAINIYEPRSGPNIVQLIQAKFKFQPLNEDKFLCFSCNNWLINWHSLQAVNSNDADSQSRSQSPPHMGNNMGSGALVQQRSKPRPVAQVRPQPKVQQVAVAPHVATAQSAPATHSQVSTPPISYNKRRFARRTAAGTRGMRKVLRYCQVCGAARVLRLLTATPAQTLVKLARRSVHSQCRKCRDNELTKWRNLHRRSQAKLAQLQRALGTQQPAEQTLVSAASSTAELPYQRFQAPRVNGKVVAMFRRLGTTLSSEQEPTASARPLRIMSPVKERPRWTRALDEDEILLEFDSIVTEVLPTASALATPAAAQATTARRRLRYQVDSMQEAETEARVQASNRKGVAKLNITHQTHVNLAGLQLPQGLSITLI